MIIKFKKIHPNAKIPAYALEGDAGMDLFSIENKIIKYGQVVEIHTGVEIELPKGTVGLVWDKCGLAAKHGIKTTGGVFDQGYRGEIVVNVTTVKKNNYKIEKGDKIAQLLVQKIEQPRIKVVKKLSSSTRGKRGFGSTGRR